MYVGKCHIWIPYQTDQIGGLQSPYIVGISKSRWTLGIASFDPPPTQGLPTN